MTKRPKSRTSPDAVDVAGATTLATVLAALEQPSALSATRLRDLRSAVKRVADMLGNEPGAVALDIEPISARLAAINRLAIGLTASESPTSDPTFWRR